MADYERDPSKILITGYSNGFVRANAPNSLIIDATLTALEPVNARLPNGFKQPIVEEIRPRVYQVTFIPSDTANKTIALELLYGDELLGKPMIFMVKSEEDLKSLVLKDRSGGFLPSIVYASLQFEALIDVTKAGKIDDLVAEIILLQQPTSTVRPFKVYISVAMGRGATFQSGPDGKLRKSVLTENYDKGMFLLNFVPDSAGLYVIIIYVNGKPFSDPYNLTAVPIGLANKCFVEPKSHDKFWTVGEPKVFVVNTKNGGEGALNILSNNIDLETKIEKNMDGLYTAVLTPKTEGQHRIMLIYGGVEIPGGTFDFECIPSLVNEEKKASGQIMDSNTEYLMPHNFHFSVNSEYQFNKLTASVKLPSGAHDIAHIKLCEDLRKKQSFSSSNNGNGSVAVKYYPKEYGRHLLSIQHDGINMTGSPISFYVNEADEEYVTVYGPGLLHAVVGEAAAFTICAKGSPTKELSVAIEGTTKAIIKCHDNKDGTCSVAWIPSSPGEHKVHVKLSGKPVKNSPFIVFAIDEGQKQTHLSLESTATSEIQTITISITVDSTRIEGLSASVRSPNGVEEPCFIRQIDLAHIGISFSPREIGEHLITIKENERIIQESNFQVETGDASKVVVSGTGKTNAICQQDNNVIIDMHDSGCGNLSISIQGPSEAELKCIENKGNLANVVYRPTEPGIYILSVKFAGVHVKDSPFTINCAGKGMGKVKESISKEVKQAPAILPEQDTALYLHLENVSPLDINARIIHPNGYSEDAVVRDLGDNLYRIEFRPAMDGPHAVSIFYKGQHILGSPFQFTVGQITEVGSYKVRAAGFELKRAEANRKQSFNLYTREAGQGELEVTVEGPSKAELQFYEHEDGNCHFDYKIPKAGEYLISIKFNAEHIPDSPFKVFVASVAEEVLHLELISLSNSGTPGEECSFMINKHGAIGNLEAKVHTPANEIEAINIVPIDENDSYCIRFIPLETGDYYVDVTLDGIPIHESPFRFRIGTSQGSDPSIITVIGDGIHSGQTGQTSEFVINTYDAGMGFLQIRIDGPSKVTLNACEVCFESEK
ncbi:hypothetical protein X798_00252 [Onchocerca flexuosa]|uniref:Filamin/ABP280 repeat protein n=1 Tax=Onchocerca flexuosa TaxID=387005 RepID=A0A238C590_9BILA|nr:hypothetical protein X798_00252 [Onchocerca flexuosa]